MSPPNVTLFRKQATDHRLDEKLLSPLRVSPPWTWSILLLVLAALLGTLGASLVLTVDVVQRSRGITRPRDGLRTVTAAVAGNVSEVAVEAGVRVKGGAIVAHIDSPQIALELKEAERQLEAVTSSYFAIAARRDAFYQQQRALLRARLSYLEQQIVSYEQTVEYRARRLAADQRLLERALVSAATVEETNEQRAQAARELASARSAYANTKEELASLEKAQEAELWDREQTLELARARREAALVAHAQTVVRAPIDGVVDAIIARPGDAVAVGQQVAKVISVDSPLRVIAFLPERDRAFVRAGDVAEVELDQLPHFEFGTLHARVTRISDDLASKLEVRDAFGEDVDLGDRTYRTELEITDRAAADAAHVQVRSGMLLNVRFALRRQRLITAALQPLRRWFHE